jgi:acetyl-CoA decarbonylase/synthase complex subunit gamma
MQIQTLQFVKRASPPPWTAGSVQTPAGSVYRVSSEWSRADHLGMIKSRMGAFRMNYAVPAGLYAMGAPTNGSEVFVTANYKLTFDILRRSIKGLNAWVLVLDTKSINVWCAAGKGTFGTDELIMRVRDTKLDAVVNHQRLILPQLGAVGVNAAEVRKQTGFRVSFGPVQARDIRAYLQAGLKKTKEMSTITFPMLDRLVLTPMEINPVMKKYPWFAAAVLLLFGLQPSGVLFREAWSHGWPFLALGLITVLAGALATPLLLPFIPFRSFAVKGWIVGMTLVLPAVHVLGIPYRAGGLLLSAAAVLLFPALASYIALQFTGSTTFTGMSGVNKELRIGIPAYVGSAAAAAVLLVLFKLKEWSLL